MLHYNFSHIECGICFSFIFSLDKHRSHHAHVENVIL